MPSTGLVTGEGSLARRSRVALVVLACAVAMLAGAVAGAPASAETPYIAGVSDQNLGLWSGNYQDASTIFDPPFPDFFGQSWVGDPPSHIQYARFVTAPDAATQGGACEQNLYNWFTYVTQTLHLVPVIAVWDVAEGGCADNGAPSTAAYTTDIGQLLAYLDGLGAAKVQYLEAWNEPNSSSISAAQAADYWTAANAVCATDGCTAIAGDLVDNDPDQGSQTFEPGCATGLTYNNMASYETAYVAALGAARPAIWGFHPYFAVNCEQSASVTTFEQNLPAPAGQVWFTEVGAWECVRGQTPPRGPTQQNADASYLVNDLMTAADAPTQVFWYEVAPLVYTQSCSKYADSALYEGTQAPGFLYARPAAATVYGVDGALAAVTDGASGESAGQATLNGTATPAGIHEGSYFFQYGPTNTYGLQTPSILLGPGLAPAAVSATVSALTPGVAYHYRLVVTDTNGTQRDGDDQVMTPPAVSAVPAGQTGAALTVSWSGITEPASSDWIGLYAQGASSATSGLYLDSCATASDGAVPAPSGSCTYALPDAAGAYVLRLYAQPGSGLLASSGAITVTSPVITPPVIPSPVLPPAPVVPPTVHAVAQASPAAPVDASAPLIRGAARAGHTLACAPGSWSGAPTAFAFSWLRDGAVLAGASAATELVTAADAGHALECAVTATNAGGVSASAASAPVSVLALPPTARVLGVAVNRRARTVTVRFDATGDATAARCALVHAGSPQYALCGSPRTFAGVRPGRYVLYVVARGPGGSQATPTVYRFTVAPPPRQ